MLEEDGNAKSDNDLNTPNKLIMCDGLMYDHVNEICCEDVLYPRQKHHVCCGKVIYIILLCFYDMTV